MRQRCIRKKRNKWVDDEVKEGMQEDRREEKRREGFTKKLCCIVFVFDVFCEKEKEKKEKEGERKRITIPRGRCLSWEVFQRWAKSQRRNPSR